MRSHFRKTLPDMDEVNGRMTKAANSAATQMEGWAKDGYDSMKARPAIWGAASLGIGALAGGIYALWRNNGFALDTLWPRNGKASRRTVAARARTKQSRRAKLKMNAMASESATAPAKRAKRTRRSRPAAHAEA